MKGSDRDSIGIKVTDTKIVLHVPPSFHAKQNIVPAKAPRWDEEDDDEDDVISDDEEAEEEADIGYDDGFDDSMGDDFGDESGEEEAGFDDDANLGKRMTSRQLSIAMRRKTQAERQADDPLGVGGLAE